MKCVNVEITEVIKTSLCHALVKDVYGRYNIVRHASPSSFGLKYHKAYPINVHVYRYRASAVKAFNRYSASDEVERAENPVLYSAWMKQPR